MNRKNNPLLFPTLLTEPDELFRDFFTPLSKMKTQILGPATNVSEDEKQITMSMVVPGLSKDKITVSIDNRILTVSYSEESESENKTNSYIRKEFAFNSFSRSFTLPDNLNENLITSKLENGILSINIPKQEKEKPKNKNIEIQ